MTLTIIVTVGAIGLFMADAVVTTSDLQETDVAATGTFVFSGNVSNGNLVNITSGSNVYRFEFNTTAFTPIVCQTTNCIAVNLTRPNGGINNESWLASGNLTAAINANATVAALLTAVNTTNTTTLTAVTAGTGGNSISLADNGANITSTGLSGGLAASEVAAMQTNILSAGQTGSSLIVILVIAMIGSLAIGYMFGMIGNRKAK